MATINAISVALFNAAAGGYSAEMEKNGAAFANAVGPILEKDVSTDALFVEHLLGNFGVSSTNAVYAQAKAAVAALVTTKGRLGAANDAADFLKAQEGSTSAFAGIAADFAAKVNKAALFTAANPTERDITKLISGVTGVDTDVAAVAAAVAAQKAADDAAAAKAAAAAAAELAAANKAATDAATAAKAAADKAASDAATALKAAQDKAAADLTAANTAAAAAAKTAADAATKAAADAATALKAAQDKAAADADAAAKALAAVNNTTYASEQAAFDAAAKKAADDAAALKTTTDAAAKAAADEIAALKAELNTLKNPAGGNFALTTTVGDVLIGTTGNDTFTGTALTTDADSIIDSSTTDKDVANLIGLTSDLDAGGRGVITIKNVETINVTSSLSGGTVFEVDASEMTGAKTITVGRDKIGSSILGKGQVNVDLVGESGVTIKAGANVTSFTTSQLDDSTATDGYTVDATGVAGDVTTEGAANVTANDVDAQHTVSVQGGALTGGDKFDVTVNAAKAGTVNVGTTANITGSVTLNAAAATTVAVKLNGTSSAATINAAKAKTLSVDNINSTGTTIAGGTISTSASSTSSWATFTLDGTDATTDAVTVTAGGYVNIDSDGTGGQDIESLTLGGNGTSVNYTISGGAPSKVTLSGADSVTLRGDLAKFASKTVTDTTTGGVGKVKITAIATPAAADLKNVKVSSIDIAADNTNYAFTLPTGANVILSKDQTGGVKFTSYTTKGTLNLSTADDTSASGDAIVIDTGGVTLLNGFTTVNLKADVGSYTGTGFDTKGSASTNVAVLSVSGSKDVTLNTSGVLKAKTIDATQLTGVLTATQTADSRVLSSGTGADVITLNGAAVFTTDAGDGDNDVTITSASAGSQLTTGGGDDEVVVDDAGSFIISTGAGADTVTLGAASDSIIDAGSGSDTLTTSGDTDLSSNLNTTFIGFEKIALSGGYDLKVTNQQIASNKTFALSASSSGSVLTVVDADITGTVVSNRYTTDGTARMSSTNDVLDLSTITVASSGNATVVAKVGQGANTIKGTAATTDTVDVSGLNDVIDNANASSSAAKSVGVVVNLSSSAVNGDTIATKSVYIGGALVSAAAGSISYLYAAVNGSSAVSSDVVSTVTGVENVTGSAGKDYIVGSAIANVIVGNGGNDYIDAGAGNDTITTGAGNSTVRGGTGKDDITFGIGTNTLEYSAKSQTGAVTFSTGAASTTSIDVITGAGAGEKIDLTGISATYATFATLNTTGTTIGASGTVVARVKGDLVSGVFTASSTGADLLVAWDNDAGSSGTTVEGIVLVGVTDVTSIAAGVITV